MAFTAVNKSVITLKDHITASALMVTNSTVTVTRVQVRNRMIGHHQYYLKYPKFNMKLTDIDECMTGVEQCDHNCENTVGSYTCFCDSRFTLNADGYHCDGK